MKRGNNINIDVEFIFLLKNKIKLPFPRLVFLLVPELKSIKTRLVFMKTCAIMK